MTEPCILQFGTSRFLQAHVDWFAHEAAEAGQTVPPITVVQVTGDASRAGRLAGFDDPAGFPVVVRGIGPEGTVDRTTRVRSVRQGLSVARDWPIVVDMFVTSASHIVSNTGDTGYSVASADRTPAILDGEGSPASFPGILLALLHRRWSAGGPGPTLLPCELVRRNGDVLRDTIVDLAESVGAPRAFVAWLHDACLWANTLVDRIVSAPIFPVGAVAEPYALWAIERQPGLAMPFHHPDVVLTNDLEPYERLKLHILNLGHCWLAENWSQAAGPTDTTVRGLVGDPDILARLRHLYAAEVLPGFTAYGLGDEAKRYVEQTLTRFANPFLDHRIGDIFDGHAIKVAKRIGGFLEWVDARDATVAMPELRAIARRYAPTGQRG